MIRMSTLKIERHAYRAFTVVSLIFALFASPVLVAAAFIAATLAGATELLGCLPIGRTWCIALLMANAAVVAAAGQGFLGTAAAALTLFAIDAAFLSIGLRVKDEGQYNATLLIGAMSLATIGLAAVEASELFLTHATRVPRLQECIVLMAAQDFFASTGGRFWPHGRLAPRISPNKTVSGAAFGLAAGIGAWLVLRDTIGSNFTLVQAVITLTAGTLGDLMFSSIKRALLVKDFSRLLGRKGGILDRIDSTVISSLVSHAFHS